MPLKITEIGVRMAVRGPQEIGEPTPGAAAGKGGRDCGGPAHLLPAERDALLDECVRIVLETLQRQKAR